MDPPEPAAKPEDEDKKEKKGITLTLEPSNSVPVLDNFFENENEDGESVISLSVYNGPEQMAAKKPRPVTTQDALLRRIPGWKKPKAKV